jgi:hypothetical protein
MTQQNSANLNNDHYLHLARRDDLFEAVKSLAGRNRPVQLDELRFDVRPHGVDVLAAPLNSFVLREKEIRGFSSKKEAHVQVVAEPNKELWRDATKALKALWLRERPRLVCNNQITKQLFPKTPDVPEKPEIKIYSPQTIRDVKACANCDTQFYSPYPQIVRMKYCCEHCYDVGSGRAAARNARNAARKEASAKARENRECAHCREIFTPKSGAARYCSTRCRVAAHRAR